MKPRSERAYRAVRRGHRRLLRLQLWTAAGGHVMDLPVEDGEIRYSLSTADGVRSGRVVVPGYDLFSEAEPGRVSWVRPVFDIDGEEWDHGEFPILRAVARRPRGDVELTLGDWAERRDTMAENAVTIGSASASVASVVGTYMGHVTPGGVFTVTDDDSFGAKCQSPVEVPIGASVWRALTTLANQVGCVINVTSRSTGQLRKYDPSAPFHDDTDGVMVDEVGAVVGDEAVNRVVVQAERSNPEGGTTVYRAVRTLTGGPYAYSSAGIGKRTLVEVLRQPEVTQAMVDAEADRLFARRVGVVRSHEISVVPLPWLEAGDVVAYRSSVFGGVMHGLVDEVSMPLTATDSMRLRLRDSLVPGRSGGDG